ncbi:MAG: hypothetical protein NT160_06215, partial [Actinobacteria bacterium]|nr:hypothetical protein [Actinomycetota bacterium]
ITDGNGDCQVAGYPGQSYNIQVSLAEQPGFPIPSTVSATLDLATADTALSLTTRFFTYAQSRGNSQGNVLIQSPSGTSLAGLSIASGTGLGLPSEDQVLVGKVGYSVHDVALGGSIDMYFALPAGSLPNVIFQVTPAGTKDISNLATFSGDVVKLHLTDGGQGDEDGIANGIIVDPMVPVRRLAKAVSPAPTPTITGKAIMASTLVAKVGKWQRGATLSYFWMRNGAAITGASASSYVLTAADVGQQISVAVVGSVAGYRSVTIASTAVTPTAGALKAGKPAITGKAQVGQVLSANAGTWAPGVSLSYSWLRNGQAIFLALGSTYTLRAGDAGQQISVQVTAKLAGYVTAIVISKAVKAKA